MTEMISQVNNKTTTAHRNLPAKALLNIALASGEGKLDRNGALSVTTGRRTARSPLGRFIVQDEITRGEVDWGTVNQPISMECFERLWQRTQEYLKAHTHFISNLAVGPAKLSKEQAAYYFLSGYTALVGSTEVGQGSGIKQTFSTFFGAPFFPRSPDVYANLLIHHIERTNCPVYLVNTGWTGGAYGEGGKRFDIPMTRTVIKAILNQELEKATYEVMPKFKLVIPAFIKGVDKKLLNPINAWWNVSDYNRHAKELIEAFITNFKKFKVSSEITTAGPELI